MRSLAILMAGVVLYGCALPQTPAERLAMDVAVCQRHAKEGPGGPSRLVGDRNYISPRVNRAGLSEMPNPNAMTTPERVYRECLEVRGHAMPSNGLVPVNPDTIGISNRAGDPV